MGSRQEITNQNKHYIDSRIKNIRFIDLKDVNGSEFGHAENIGVTLGLQLDAEGFWQPDIITGSTESEHELNSETHIPGEIAELVYVGLDAGAPAIKSLLLANKNGKFLKIVTTTNPANQYIDAVDPPDGVTIDADDKQVLFCKTVSGVDTYVGDDELTWDYTNKQLKIIVADDTCSLRLERTGEDATGYFNIEVVSGTNITSNKFVNIDITQEIYLTSYSLSNTSAGFIKRDTNTNGGKLYLDTNNYINTTRGNWKVFYSNGSGVFTELALGGDNTFLRSNGLSIAPDFSTINLSSYSHNDLGNKQGGVATPTSSYYHSNQAINTTSNVQFNKVTINNLNSYIDYSSNKLRIAGDSIKINATDSLYLTGITGSGILQIASDGLVSTTTGTFHDENHLFSGSKHTCSTNESAGIVYVTNDGEGLATLNKLGFANNNNKFIQINGNILQAIPLTTHTQNTDTSTTSQYFDVSISNSYAKLKLFATSAVGTGRTTTLTTQDIGSDIMVVLPSTAGTLALTGHNMTSHIGTYRSIFYTAGTTGTQTVANKSFSGESGKFLKVNTGGDDLEFSPVSFNGYDEIYICAQSMYASGGASLTQLKDIHDDPKNAYCIGFSGTVDSALTGTCKLGTNADYGSIDLFLNIYYTPDSTTAGSVKLYLDLCYYPSANSGNYSIVSCTPLNNLFTGTKDVGNLYRRIFSTTGISNFTKNGIITYRIKRVVAEDEYTGIINILGLSIMYTTTALGATNTLSE